MSLLDSYAILTLENCFLSKGLFHYVTLATKRLHIVLFHKDITQLEQKNSSYWYICNLSPHRVSAMLVHYF